jgi:hypothetical protein
MDRFLEERFDDDESVAEERKRQVGMAEPGTDEYFRNAAYVLGSYTHPNSQTREKLEWLTEHGYM